MNTPRWIRKPLGDEKDLVNSIMEAVFEILPEESITLAENEQLSAIVLKLIMDYNDKEIGA